MFPRLQPSACYEELPYSYFRPTSSARLLSRGTIPLIRPIMIYCFTLYPWYFCFNPQRSGPYFVVFSSFFFSRFVTHGQLISSVMTRFDSWFIMRSSTLLAIPSWCSANSIEGHPTMLVHCSPLTLDSVSVASAKVAPSLQGLGLAKSRRKVSSGLRYVE